MAATLAQTALHDWHVANGGRMVDFAGWSMPVQYTSIVAEHAATRNAAGLFDISHMGRFFFDGRKQLELLEYAVTNDVWRMCDGQVRYNLVCNAAGGILDDVLVYDWPGTQYSMVVNASNRLKIWRHLQSCSKELGLTCDFREGPTAAPPMPMADVVCDDMTLNSSMIAIQGPRALAILQPLVDVPLGEMKYYSATAGHVSGEEAFISRTGYTGEDGCELILEPSAVEAIWQQLVDSGATPCGLGARDTLRLEAAMPLYGHELNEQINPYQAGLAWAVKLDKGRFVGDEALKHFKADPKQPKRVGLEFESKRVPREGFAVTVEGRKIGETTSGTFSPTLNKPIAMAYVEPEFAAVGTEVAVDIRGRNEPARIVALPFYKRK